MPTKKHEVTRELNELAEGDRAAARRLFPLVYQELRDIAGGCFHRESVDHTLQPTALVHEAYLRLVDDRRIGWESRAEFFGIAAQAMRRVLIDHARGRRAAKRGGSKLKLAFDEALLEPEQRDAYLIALDTALGDLAEIDPDLAKIVELRFFGGLTVDETAKVLKRSPKTIKRHWALARAWLHQSIAKED